MPHNAMSYAMPLEKLRGIIDEIERLPKVRIVVSKYAHPDAMGEYPIKGGGKGDRLFVMGEDFYRRMENSSALVTILKHRGVPADGIKIEFTPEGWKPTLPAGR